MCHSDGIGACLQSRSSAVAVVLPVHRFKSGLGRAVDATHVSGSVRAQGIAKSSELSLSDSIQSIHGIAISHDTGNGCVAGQFLGETT